MDTIGYIPYHWNIPQKKLSKSNIRKKRNRSCKNTEHKRQNYYYQSRQRWCSSNYRHWRLYQWSHQQLNKTKFYQEIPNGQNKTSRKKSQQNAQEKETCKATLKKKEKARFSISKNTRVFYGAKINKNPKSWKVGNGLF